MTRTRPLFLVAAMAAIMLASGCGSTVGMQGPTGDGEGLRGVAIESESERATASPSVEGPGRQPGGGPRSPVSATQGATGNSAGAASPQGGGPPSSVASEPGPPPATEPVEVGIFVQTDSSELAESMDADHLQNGDERAFAQALVDDLNERGGIAGREVVPVYYTFDPTTQSDVSVAQQEACAQFTEDHDVFAALLGWHAYPDHQLATCLQRRDVIAVNSAGIQTGEAQALDPLTNYFAPPGVELGRQARNYVDALWRQGFFPSDAKVGLISLDSPEYRRAVSEALIPALERHGISLADSQYYPPLQRSSDVASQSAAVSNAVLRFKAGGIAQVLFLQYGVNGPVFFMRTAESQNYYPRYGLSTTDAPSAVAPFVSPNQLSGALGMGWQAANDVLAGQEDISAPRRGACLELLKERTGETFANRSVEYVGLTFCDSVWFFEHVAQRTTPLTAANFRTTSADLGTSYASPLVLATNFGERRRDGAASFRNLLFDDVCGCFIYRGQAQALN